jgi:putative ABC transport system permease protein
MLFVTFALFALGMAAIGIYGVMSYSVSQRRPEIGIRMALGAESSTVRRMVVKQGFIVVTIGIALGLPLALVLGRMMAATLFGVSTTDPVVFGGVPLVLAVVAFVATYLPALRATRRDPMRALRSE